MSPCKQAWQFEEKMGQESSDFKKTEGKDQLATSSELWVSGTGIAAS